jgi:hypothetical protein
LNIAKQVDDAHRQHEGERGRGGQREERLLHIGGLFRGELCEIVNAKRLLDRRHSVHHLFEAVFAEELMLLLLELLAKRSELLLRDDSPQRGE